MAVKFGKKAPVRWKWDGVPELKKTYQAVGQSLDDKTPEVKAVIQPVAESAMEAAARLAPQAERTYEGRDKQQFPPGTLRSSLKVDPRSSRYRGVLMYASTKIAYYAGFVEYGTRKMQARPYFRPSIVHMQASYAADIAPGCKALIEKTCAANAYKPK